MYQHLQHLDVLICYATNPTPVIVLIKYIYVYTIVSAQQHRSILHLVAGQALGSLNVLPNVFSSDIPLLSTGVGHALGLLPLCATELAASDSWRVAADVGSRGVGALVIRFRVSATACARILGVEYLLGDDVVVIVTAAVPSV
jgi:hypothetical protein